MRARTAVLAAAAVLVAAGAPAGATARTSAPLPRSALAPNAIAFSTALRGLLGTGRLDCADPTTHCRLGGTIQLTTDGGKSWRVVSRTSWPVVSVSIDSAGDWARLENGETLHAGHGGETWARAVPETPSATPCPPALDVSLHEDVVTAHHEWALCAGEGGAGNMAKAVYRLASTGFHRVAYTPFTGRGGYGGISSYGYPEGMAMADEGFGLIWESRGTLYVTRDGGTRWIGEPRVAVPDTDFGLSGSALPRGVGFVLLERNQRSRLLETTNAGRTWRAVHRWR